MCVLAQHINEKWNIIENTRSEREKDNEYEGKLDRQNMQSESEFANIYLERIRLSLWYVFEVYIKL